MARQRHLAELAVDDTRRFEFARALEAHPRGQFDDRRFQWIEFSAGAIDFQFGDRPFAFSGALDGPAKDVLAAAFGMPKDLVTAGFFSQIELTDGERRMRAAGHAPARFGGRLIGFERRGFVPQMEAEDCHQGPGTPIGNQGAPRGCKPRRQNWSAPGEFLPDNMGWDAWPKTIASDTQSAPLTHRWAMLVGSNVVLRTFLA